MKPILCSIIVIAMVQGCSSREEPPPPLDIRSGEFISAKRCGDCHRDIYQVWATSLHANALTNPTFQASVQEISNDQKSVQSCMGCHAPVSQHVGQSIDAPAAREGVTCDYCHSISGSDTSNNVTLDIGGAKYGPVANAHSTGHAVQYSTLHTKSEVCSGCHEYNNTNGLKVLGTFSEWRSSESAAAGVTCQRCHMPLSTLNIVDPRIKRQPSSFVNLHQMPGGHSKDQLFKALDLRILEATRRGADIEVKVLVHNKGAGHNVPTGMPTRQIVLTATVSGSKTGRQEQSRTFGSTVHDSAGRPLDRDSQVVLAGVRFARDTRLKPGEKRTETFKFKINANENIDLASSLTYRYMPLGVDKPGLDFSFWERRQQSVMQWSEGKPVRKEKQ